MFIDENKVAQKSREYSKGYKGMLPAKPLGSRRAETLRTAIGVVLAVSFALGLLGLIYTLFTEGRTAVERITSETSEQPQYMEITFKPKPK